MNHPQHNSRSLIGLYQLDSPFKSFRHLSPGCYRDETVAKRRGLCRRVTLGVAVEKIQGLGATPVFFRYLRPPGGDCFYRDRDTFIPYLFDQPPDPLMDWYLKIAGLDIGEKVEWGSTGHRAPDNRLLQFALLCTHRQAFLLDAGT